MKLTLQTLRIFSCSSRDKILGGCPSFLFSDVGKPACGEERKMVSGDGLTWYAE